MNKIERMLQELCPEGVEYKKLGEVCVFQRGSTITAKEAIEGDVPVIAGGQKPAYYHNVANRQGKTVVVAGSGAYAGFVTYWEIPIFVSDAFSVNPHGNLDTKYLYYYLKNIQENIHATKKGSGVPHVHGSSIAKFEIPIPPLLIQEEIVRILDHFTELTAELQAELQARQEQYKYYKDQLLKLNVAEYRTLGSLSKFRRGSFPQPYGNKDWYDGDGAMPFVQVADIADDKKLVANTKRKISSLAQPMSVFAPKGSIIISLQGSIGKIAITQYDAYIDRTLAIFQNITNDVLPKYFVYQLERIFEIKEKTARGSTIKTITKEEFTNFQIPIPSISEQKRIVFILDKFETLVGDLSQGLPAEIAAVQEQYEYYRNKLLTFKRIA